jgi:DNA-binding MarR family transcriptional regulator
MTAGATVGSSERAALVRAATAALETAAETAARELDRHAAGFGLSNAKLEMLGVLRRCAGLRACLYDLGDRLGVTRPNITKLVDGLERGGLVERIPHPADKRMVQAHLTARGAALADWALPGRAERIEWLWAGLDDEELATLIQLLETAASHARQQGHLEAGTV